LNRIDPEAAMRRHLFFSAFVLCCTGTLAQKRNTVAVVDDHVITFTEAQQLPSVEALPWSGRACISDTAG
jgi:hypothetical protein